MYKLGKISKTTHKFSQNFLERLIKYYQSSKELDSSPSYECEWTKSKLLARSHLVDALESQDKTRLAEIISDPSEFNLFRGFDPNAKSFIEAERKHEKFPNNWPDCTLWGLLPFVIYCGIEYGLSTKYSTSLPYPYQFSPGDAKYIFQKYSNTWFKKNYVCKYRKPSLCNSCQKY